MAKNEIEAQLIGAGVRNLREFGYPGCTAENIVTDDIYSQFFLSMLEQNKGKSTSIDRAIDALIARIKGNSGGDGQHKDDGK